MESRGRRRAEEGDNEGAQPGAEEEWEREGETGVMGCWRPQIGEGTEGEEEDRAPDEEITEEGDMVFYQGDWVQVVGDSICSRDTISAI